MMKKIAALVLLTALVVSACQSPKEKALSKIKGLEGNDSAFTNELMTELKTAYVDFAKAYPDDELAPEYLFKAAQRSIALELPNEALEHLNMLAEKYPKSPFVEDAMFLAAYTCENNLNDLPKAKALYDAFIKKYPKSELAKDAQFALENLGKSPEEVLQNLPETED